MPTLRISSRVQAFGDTIPGQQAEPLQRYCDWERFASGMAAREVSSDRHVVAAGQTLTLANLASVTGIAAGALYSLKAHPSKSNRYQVRYLSGAISNPLAGLGTGLLTPGNTYTVTQNADGSINVTDTSVSPVNFGSSLARGDVVYLAGSGFGDTAPWNANNQGFWSVVNVRAVGVNPGAMLVLQRVDAADPLGFAETITAAAAVDLQKSFDASAALIVGVAAYAGTWAVVESAAGWFSIESLSPLPDVLSTGALTALTLVQSQFLGYARVEVDGMAVVTSKAGDLTQGQQLLRPVKFVDPLASPVGGWLELYGLLTLLTVQNAGDRPLSVNVVLGYLEA